MIESFAVDKPWLMLGDCLERMAEIPDGSVDMIACDLPYGTTVCSWDSVIPFEPLWRHYLRVIKHNGAVVLTASQPFTSALVMSNIKAFKYEWIWEKAVGSNFATLKRQPMKEHESVLVFSPGTPFYNPIMQQRKGKGNNFFKYVKSNSEYKSQKGGAYDAIVRNRDGVIYDKLRYPSSVQFFNNRESGRGIHPTQKPVSLFEYMINTYTRSGEIVLDNCFGSGTTGVACVNTGRRFIGIERHEPYFDIGRRRIEAAIDAIQPALQGGLFDANEALNEKIIDSKST